MCCFISFQQDSRKPVMNIQMQLLALTVLILSPQIFVDADGQLYNIVQENVKNANLLSRDNVDRIINARDLLMRKARKAKDCNELFRHGYTMSGLYVIQPDPVDKTPLLVVNCEMEYDCGGWTVLERKSRSSPLTWNETWTTYQYGFGNILADHYLGNEYIYFLTNQMWYKARVVLEKNRNGKKIQRFAEYDIFRVGPEKYNYPLYLGAYKGNAGDALSVPGNMVDNLPFSTRDKDSDLDSQNCANKYGGGWWFNTCPSREPFAMLTKKESIYWEPYGDDAEHVTILVRSVNMYCRKKGLISKI
ncbi:fibrinogen-like protein 1-like protein [Hypanus sabinus]|uniref:fibrinogen-like protein 1-like protein n=1 Tax=Hypanus sabinus TaxID=79690 RepID=UPI0028C41393|nr:fibrinogen-like protein 1-like protein [Hypanus sabinus]